MAAKSKNESRENVRVGCRLNKYVEESLQSCSIAENRYILMDKINNLNDPVRVSKLKALVYIWDSLLAEVDGRMRSHMLFEEGFNVFIGFSHYHKLEATKKDREYKNTFRLSLLHKTYGLRVMLVSRNNTRWIVLKPDNFHLDTFFLHYNEYNADEVEKSNLLHKDLVQLLVQSMDSEWDRRILRHILSYLLTRQEIDNLGIDGDSISHDAEIVNGYLGELESLEKEAEDDVINSLQRRKNNLVAEMSQKRKLLLEKRKKWTCTQIEERREEAEDIRQKVNDINITLAEKGRGSRSWKSRVARSKKKIIDGRRLKKRNLGSGRKRLVTDDGERYVAKCVEEKATAHGRRHDSVLYLQHRVKKKDLLKLINRYHVEQNLPLVKSASTIYQRGRPKMLKSYQAKRQKGLSLFCCKKSPKSEEKGNILTHHCRALKKNVIRRLFEMVGSDSVIYRSYDDKAYLCPETSTGMQSSRAQKVFTSTDTSKEKRFLKYDFPEKYVNCTPGTFLYMEKEVKMIDGKEKVVTCTQDALVQVKPKFFVGSSVSVWSSHLFDNRHNEPVLHEIPNTSDLPVTFRSSCWMVADAIRSFVIQSEQEDAVMMPEGAEYVDYERKKIRFLEQYTTHALSKISEESNIDVTELVSKLEQLREICGEVELNIENLSSGQDYWTDVCRVINLCEEILLVLQKYNLPRMKPIVVDLTDAGPGVGITNLEVAYRVSCEIMIADYDYYNRIHMAPNDSSSNEVERIQSSVGDAVCDGTYLNWEYHEKFADLSEQDLQNMTPADHERYEFERMHRNANEVCKEVCARIDGAPTIDGYLKSYVSKDLVDLFFWDSVFLKKFISLKESAESKCPGYHFYSNLDQFASLHFRKGEKYLEFVKFACKTTMDDDACEFCTGNPWQVRTMLHIPEPYPDVNTGSYLHIKDTPRLINSVVRDVDDFNPRVQLKLLFRSGELNVGNAEMIEAFSSKFIVDRGLVEKYLKHLHGSAVVKDSKKKERTLKKQNEEKKKYEDYDWQKLIGNEELKKMVVKSLDKYIAYHSLDHLKDLRKHQKVEGIKCHFMRNLYQESPEDTEVSSEEHTDNETDSNSSDDEVLPTSSRFADKESNEDVREWEDESLFTVNRYGRAVGSLKK